MWGTATIAMIAYVVAGNTYCWGGGVGNGIAFEDDDDPIQVGAQMR